MLNGNNEVVLNHLLDGNIITTRTAPSRLGIADVRANIRDLRNIGYKISDRWVSSVNRRGRKTRYKEYFIKEDNE